MTSFNQEPRINTRKLNGESLQREWEWAIYLQPPVEMPQPLGSRGSVCEDHSHSWHSLTILSPITDLLQRLPMIPEIESGLASSPTEWTSGGGLWSVRHFRRFSLTAGYCRQSLMPMFFFDGERIRKLFPSSVQRQSEGGLTPRAVYLYRFSHRFLSLYHIPANCWEVNLIS